MGSNGQFIIYDIRIKENPLYLAKFNTNSNVIHAAVLCEKYNIIYLADDNNGLSILKVYENGIKLIAQGGL